MANILVIGAGRGIGLELCRQYKGRGDSVVAVCRTVTDEIRALDVQLIGGVDVADADAPKRIALGLGTASVDIMVHNAGVFLPSSLATLDSAALLDEFRINALAPLLTVSAVLPRLARGSKIGLVTSQMGSIGDNSSGGYYGYRMSKAALNMAGMSLARDLAPSGIAVAILHPGYVRTRMTGNNGTIDADTSARGLIERLDALSMESTGTFWGWKGNVLPW